MNETLQLAGFLAAEAILQVATGASLAPLILFEGADDGSHIIRIHEASPEHAALKGEQILRTNAAGAKRGVLAIDAYLNLPKGRTDAIFLQAYCFLPVARQLVLAVPYRHARKPGGFAVQRLTVLAFEDEPLPQPDLVTAFFGGVDRHPKGGKFWQEHRDESC